jgi:hypothetical protein
MQSREPSGWKDSDSLSTRRRIWRGFVFVKGLRGFVFRGRAERFFFG